MSDRRLLVACVTSSVVGVLFSAFVHANWTSINLYSDIWSFWGRSWVAAGNAPYSSSGAFLEYPPVSGLLLYSARSIGGAISGVAGGLYAGYYVAFSALSLLAAAVLGWSTWRLGRALGANVNPVFFVLPTMVVYAVYNFDLFNALFIVLSIQFFAEKRKGWSAGFLGVALATKLVAGVLLPIFLLELADSKERWRYLLVSLVVAGAFFVPIAIYDFGYFGQFLSFYQGWGLEDAWYLWIFQNPFSQAAKGFGLIVMVLLLFRVYTLKMPLLQKSFLALASYLLGTYIYAPQFNVMLVPIAAVLAVTSPAYYFMEMFNSLIILTWFTVPATSTSGPTYPWTLPQAMALLRSASLALLSVSVASDSGHSPWGWVKWKFGWQSQMVGAALARVLRGPGAVGPLRTTLASRETRKPSGSETE